MSVADLSGALDIVVRGLKPVVHQWMGLPAEAAVVFVLGFIRRDFGAAGLLEIARTSLTPQQVLVATVAITLFVPCIANFLVIIKERGIETALGIVAFIIPFAFLVAGILNQVMNFIGGVV